MINEQKYETVPPDVLNMFTSYTVTASNYAVDLAQVADIEDARAFNNFLGVLVIGLELCIGRSGTTTAVNQELVLQLRELMGQWLKEVAVKVKDRQEWLDECTHTHSTLVQQRLCDVCGQIVD